MKKSTYYSGGTKSASIEWTDTTKAGGKLAVRRLTPKGKASLKQTKPVSFGKPSAKVEDSVREKRQEFDDVFQSILSKAGDLKSETMEQYVPAPLLSYKNPRKPIKHSSTLSLRIPNLDLEGDGRTSPKGSMRELLPPTSPYYTDAKEKYSPDLETESSDRFKAPPASAYVKSKPVPRRAERKEVKKKDLSSQSLEKLRESFKLEMQRFHQTDDSAGYSTEYGDAFKPKTERVAPMKEQKARVLTEYQEKFSAKFPATTVQTAGITQKEIATKRVSRKTFPTARRKSAQSGKRDFETEYGHSFQEPTARKPRVAAKGYGMVEQALQSEYQQRYCAPDGGVSILNPSFLNSPKPKPFKVAEPFSEYQREFDHCDLLKDESSASPQKMSISSPRAVASSKDEPKESKFSPRVGPKDTFKPTTLSQPARNFAEWWNKNGRQMWMIMNPLTRFQRYKPFANLLKTPRSEYMEAFR